MNVIPFIKFYKTVEPKIWRGTITMEEDDIPKLFIVSEIKQLNEQYIQVSCNPSQKIINSCITFVKSLDMIC